MDIKLRVTGDGAEVEKTTKDFIVINGFQNMPFLAMFGGNVKASTGPRIATEQAFDFWGNQLINPQDESIQFNSETERALNTVPLTTAGRALIQQAVEKDLAFMKDFATVIPIVSIVATDKVAIGIRLVEPNNIQKQDFIYLWDSTKQELIGEDRFTVTISSGGIFDFSFDISFE